MKIASLFSHFLADLPGEFSWCAKEVNAASGMEASVNIPIRKYWETFSSFPTNQECFGSNVYLQMPFLF